MGQVRYLVRGRAASDILAEAGVRFEAWSGKPGELNEGTVLWWAIEDELDDPETPGLLADAIAALDPSEEIRFPKASPRNLELVSDRDLREFIDAHEWRPGKYPSRAKSRDWLLRDAHEIRDRELRGPMFAPPPGNATAAYPLAVGAVGMPEEFVAEVREALDRRDGVVAVRDVAGTLSGGDLGWVLRDRYPGGVFVEPWRDQASAYLALASLSHWQEERYSGTWDPRDPVNLWNMMLIYETLAATPDSRVLLVMDRVDRAVALDPQQITETEPNVDVLVVTDLDSVAPSGPEVRETARIAHVIDAPGVVVDVRRPQSENARRLLRYAQLMDGDWIDRHLLGKAASLPVGEAIGAQNELIGIGALRLGYDLTSFQLAEGYRTAAEIPTAEEIAGLSEAVHDGSVVSNLGMDFLAAEGFAWMGILGRHGSRLRDFPSLAGAIVGAAPWVYTPAAIAALRHVTRLPDDAAPNLAAHKRRAEELLAQRVAWGGNPDAP